MNADPIWAILEHQGRKLPWLARVTGYKHGYIRKIKCGADKPSPEFRRRCATALDLPEAALFVARQLRRSQSIADGRNAAEVA